jgi:SAM-dependent methyltransferase
VRRTSPISDRYGWERGTPIDRFYIDAYVESCAHLIRGDVLELEEPLYTRRFGASATASHVLDIDPSNRQATLVADLCRARSLPRDAYDCIIATQTLQYLKDETTALVNLWHALRPGGTLLVTVPCLAALDPAYPGGDFWRYTPAGLERRLATTLPTAEIEAFGSGNVLACSAYLYGLAVEELAREDLAASDPRFPLTACATVSKPRRS